MNDFQTLNDDVAYIETQSQGLQVQTANQKLLHSELQNLLKTLSISPSYLRPLKEASLTDVHELSQTEAVLSTLYKAMLTIDPDIWQNKKRLVDAAGEHFSVGAYADTDIGQMRAIQEKKKEYRDEARVFLMRLKDFMGEIFLKAEHKMVNNNNGVGGPRDPMKIDAMARNSFRQDLWIYNPLILFAREVSLVQWHSLINLYEQQARMPFQKDFRHNILSWRHAMRQPTGEEQELLFTHQDKEKEGESIAMAARKLTVVKRGKAVKGSSSAGLLRLATGERPTDKLEPFEVFTASLEETMNAVSDEQNFVVQYFHLNSMAGADFSDLVAAGGPEARALPDFSIKQPHDPDRMMAKKVESTMDEIYSFWPTEMEHFAESVTKADPLYVFCN